MKTVLTILWTFALCGAIVGIVIVATSILQSNRLNAQEATGLVVFGVACGVLPYLFAQAVSKILDETGRK